MSKLAPAFMFLLALASSVMFATAVPSCGTSGVDCKAPQNATNLACLPAEAGACLKTVITPQNIGKAIAAAGGESDDGAKAELEKLGLSIGGDVARCAAADALAAIEALVGGTGGRSSSQPTKVQLRLQAFAASPPAAKSPAP